MQTLCWRHRCHLLMPVCGEGCTAAAMAETGGALLKGRQRQMKTPQVQIFKNMMKQQDHRCPFLRCIGEKECWQHMKILWGRLQAQQSICASREDGWLLLPAGYLFRVSQQWFFCSAPWMWITFDVERLSVTVRVQLAHPEHSAFGWSVKATRKTISSCWAQ